jgi:hypothetical protein
MSYPLWLAAISIAFVALERAAPRRPDPGLLRPGIVTDVADVVFNGHFLGLILAAATAPLSRGFERLAGDLASKASTRGPGARDAMPLHRVSRRVSTCFRRGPRRTSKAGILRAAHRSLWRGPCS